MKIELDISDLKEYYFDSNDVTVEEIKTEFINEVIQHCSYKLAEDCQFIMRGLVGETVRSIVAENKDKIITDATQQVADTILRRKAIVSQMPKKSEISAISKEWEEYFNGLIDKAIKKKFS